jgi:homoserine dehydrogenase
VATERGSVFYDLTGADAALEISTDVLGPVVITSKDPTTRDTAYGLFGDLVACVLGGR